MRAAELPDDLEMILEEHHLGVRAVLLLFSRYSSCTTRVLQALAPALRANLTGTDDQARRFAKLQREDLFAAVDASMESLKLQLEVVHGLVKKATDAKVQLQEAVDNDPANKKFSTFKAAGGTIDDFFKGLEDRIGEDTDAFCASESSYVL
jgi:hypothetical protein